MENCDKYSEMLSMYIDDMLSDEELLFLEKHLETCEKCTKTLEAYRLMEKDLADLPMLELPEGFHERAMERVSNSQKAKANNTVNAKSFVTTAAAVIACFVLLGSALTALNDLGNKSVATFSGQSAATVMSTGQGSPQELFSESATARTYTLESGDMASTGVVPFSDSVLQSAVSNQKIDIKPVNDRVLVKNYNITIVTTDVKNTFQSLKNYMAEIDGSRISDEYGWISFKADETLVAEILENMHDFGEVKNRFEYCNDVTDIINDAAIRYSEKEAEATRLIKLIERAEKAEDIIILEGRISQLEMEKAGLKATYFNNLQHSENTLISISIVKKDVYIEPVEEIFSSRIQSAFAGSVNFTVKAFEEFAVIASTLALPLIIIVSLYVAGFFILKKLRKRGGNDEE